MHHLSKCWRIFATVLPFVCAAFVLPVLAIFYIPIVRACSSDKAVSARRVRSAYAAWARILFWWAETSGCMRLHVHGQGRRDNQRTLFIANHPTYIDFLAFLSVCPQVGCVVKADLTQNRVLSYLIESAGYIASSNDASLIDSCTERLFNGESLIVFPEGTRSEGTQLRKFQRGAASIALRCDCDVVPVFYTCVPVTLQKKHSWFEVPEQAFELTLRFGEALDWQQTVPPEFAEAAARRHLTEYFEGVFGQELSHERAAA